MSEVNVEAIQFGYAPETVADTQPTAGWREIRVTDVGKFAATFGTVEQDFISPDRAVGESQISSVESTVEVTTDVTRSSTRDFIQQALMSSFVGGLVARATAFVDGGVSDDTISVASGGALAADLLVKCRGSAEAGNNAVFKVVAGSDATNIHVATGSLTAEAAPPSNAEVAVCGYEGAAGDLRIDANQDIISTTVNFTTLPLTVGQGIRLPEPGTTYAFALAAAGSVNSGYARIDKIEAHKLTLSHRGGAWVADDGTDDGAGGTAKAIRILFGEFCRNVSSDHGDFLKEPQWFEAVLPGLGTGGATRYVYSESNLLDKCELSMPLESKATFKFSFKGKITGEPTSVRATGADAAIEPNATAMFGTMSNVARLRALNVDESGLTTDFKGPTLTLDNRVSMEKVVGQLAAKYTNYRKLEAMLASEVVVTEDVLSVIRNHTTVSADAVMKNGDGAMLVDMPSCKPSSDGPTFPRGESVKAPLTLRAFKDPILGYSISFSTFPHVE